MNGRRIGVCEGVRWLTGGQEGPVVLHPQGISPTLLASNPRPLPVFWAGPSPGGDACKVYAVHQGSARSKSKALLVLLENLVLEYTRSGSS
jgi:hypothetical protein